jgi:hypothetical protein
MSNPKPDVMTPHQLRDRTKQRAAELGILLDFVACREYEVVIYVKSVEKGTSVSVSLFDAMLWDHVGMDGIGKTLVAVQRALNDF